MITLLLHILGYDIWFYISHILLHQPYLYAKIHKIHHEKKYPYWQDTYHSHWFEGPFQSLGFLLPFIFFKLSVIELFVAFLFCQARGLMRHDIRLEWLIGNHHLLHHSKTNYNYGEPWIDRLCGTYQAL
jgi:sterol desaturase/sphingolipid hydroxylase (fatty acid hydroxylase superfamily)